MTLSPTPEAIIHTGGSPIFGRLQHTVPRINGRDTRRILFFCSNFNPLFGHFNGIILLLSGVTLKLADQYGFVEEQFAK